MKRLSYIFFILIAAIILVTCKKKPELKIYTLELSEENVVSDKHSAIVSANYTYPGEIPEVKLLVSTESAMGMSKEADAQIDETTISASVDELEDDTKYYYCFRYSNGVHLVNTGIKSFTTEGYDMPVATTLDVFDIASNTARCGGEAVSDGGGTISARGVCYGTRQNPTIYNNVVNCGDSLGVFEALLENLDINTLYYVRAFATNQKGTAYGEQKSFTTLGQVPVLVTIPATSITENSAISGGTIIDDFGYELLDKGVCWSTEQHPTINDTHTSEGAESSAYVCYLTDLLPNTTYYVRAYATTTQGTGYGNELTFSTLSTIPTVTTNGITDVATSAARCGGNVISDGGAEVTARGVCWSLDHDPTISDAHTTDGTGIGEFYSEMTSLSANKKYYVRAYATNEKGTAYGEERAFKTIYGLPSVTTKDVTKITVNSAVCGGNITESGSSDIIARGVCWNTFQYPTIYNNHTTEGTGTGEFTSNIFSLESNTTYYVRAYATNSEGTSYGEQVSFTTSHAIVLATVTTNDVSNITTTSAICGGNVTSEGYGTVTARGVCWALGQNPTVNNYHSTNGSGSGEFISTLGNLLQNTTYYIRAYATNEAGTAYGEIKSFTTNQTPVNPTIPSVTTSDISQITMTSAVSGGNVTSSGNSGMIARGICWSTSENPTIEDNHTDDGLATGSYTSSMTGLEASTTYYVRAYATNTIGTAYGAQKSFTTTDGLPTVTTNNPTNITGTSAVCGGNISDDGGYAVSARGICWSTNQNPTINDTHTTEGSGSGSFTSNITGLTESVKYYVRAYAINVNGTVYGNEVSFTTISDLFTYDFNNCTAGNKIAQTLGEPWTTWNNFPGGSEDGVFGEAGGSMAAHFTYGNDQVLRMGGYETGAFDLTLDVYVPNGKSGYFNILHNFAGSGSTWAAQIYLCATNDGQSATTVAEGHGTVHAGSNGTADIPCVWDQWMRYRLHIEMENDVATLYWNIVGQTEQEICTWQWSLDGFGQNIVGPKLDALDFYPPSNGSEFYLDNVQLRGGF